MNQVRENKFWRCRKQWGTGIMECWPPAHRAKNLRLGESTGFGGMKFIFVYMTLIFYIHDTDQKFKSERHPLFISHVPFFHHSNIPSVIKRQILPSMIKTIHGPLIRDLLPFGSIVLTLPDLPQTVPSFQSCMKRIRPRFRVGFRWRLALHIHIRLNRSPIPLIRTLRNRST